MLKLRLHSIPWQFKLIALMLLMAILPSLLISYSILDLIRVELTSQTNQLLRSSANSISNNINFRVKRTKEVIELVAKTIENQNLSTEEKVSFLVSNTEKIDNVISLAVVIKESKGYSVAISSTKDFLKKKDGYLVPTSSLIENIDFSFIDSLKNNYTLITKPNFSKEINSWISWFAVKVSLNGLSNAYIAAQIDLSDLSIAMQDPIWDRIGNSFLLDKQGSPFLSNKIQAELPSDLFADAITLLNQQNTATIINNYEDEGQNKYVAYLAKPEEVDWIIVSYIKKDSAYAIVNEAIIFFSFFVGLSAILSIIIAIWFSKHLSRPIIKMASTSQLIAEGNFDIESDYKANDSIGLLNSSLTKMGSQLKINFQKIEEQKNQLEDYSKNLEIKVVERTNELNQSNKELKQAYQRVLELNEEKNEFLGIAAHDLKNPLTAVSAFADILKTDKDLSVEQHDDFLNEIAKASDRMFFIVKNLLDVNAIEQGKLNTKLQRVSLKAIVKEMNAQFAESTSKKGILLHEEYLSDHNEVLADYNLTLQVVQNILSNAIKFSPMNKNIFIVVKSNKINNMLELRVKDEGPGFTEDDKIKLFKKFSRLSARPTAGEHSTGLGLSIVKKLVEMMNGTIVLVSESGKGAEFIISLPAVCEENNIES